MTKVLKTVDGGIVTDHRAAFELAERLLTEAGFRVVAGSAQSRSTYLSRSGNDWVIRIADHSNRHRSRNAGEIELRLTLAREEVVYTWTDDVEGEIEERDVISVIRESPDEIAALVRQAVAEYDGAER